jgi:hypothetical protein
MNEQSNVPMSPEPAVGGGNERTMAIVSLIAGIISLCGLVVPIIGVPLGIIGVVLGYFGRRDAEQKNLATIGMMLSGIGILLSCVPIGLISIMRLLGPKIGNTFSSINSSLP